MHTCSDDEDVRLRVIHVCSLHSIVDYEEQYRGIVQSEVVVPPG